MGWCVLRTSGRHTLRLAQTLAADGFETWTPREVRRVRIPRANVRREAELPIMPSYVFAGADRLVDLLHLSEQDFTAHPRFTVMRFHDSIPTIADGHLQALRTLEARRQPRRKALRFANGVEVVVKIEGGSFAGMRGRVERSDEATTLVCFDNRLTVKIPTFQLSGNELQVVRSVTGTIGLKAA